MAIPAHTDVRYQEISGNIRLRCKVAALAAADVSIVGGVREHRVREKYFGQLYRVNLPGHLTLGLRYRVAVYASAPLKHVLSNL